MTAAALDAAGGRTKIATVMLLTGVDAVQAARVLAADGSVRHALDRAAR